MLEKKFYKKDICVQKSISIDAALDDKVNYLYKHVYDAPASKIINACVDELLKNEELKFYEYGEDEILVKRTVSFRRYSLDGLERLSKKYRVPIYRLIDIALRKELDLVTIEEGKE